MPGQRRWLGRPGLVLLLALTAPALGDCTATDCQANDPICNPLSAILLYQRLPRVLYATNFSSNSVNQYTINASSGFLSPIASIAAGTQPFAVATDASGVNAYTANNGGGNSSIYSISQRSGELQSLGAATAAAGAQGVAVDPSGNLAFVATLGASGIILFRRDARPER